MSFVAHRHIADEGEILRRGDFLELVLTVLQTKSQLPAPVCANVQPKYLPSPQDDRGLHHVEPSRRGQVELRTYRPWRQGPWS